MFEVKNKKKINVKFFEVFFSLLFLAAPFYYEPNWGGQGLSVPSNLAVWFCAFMLTMYGLYNSIRNNKLVLPKYMSWIVAFPLLIVLSGFVTGVQEPLGWSIRLIYVWGGLLYFVTLFQYGFKRGYVDRLLLVLMASSFGQAIIGMQQLFLPDLALYYWPTGWRAPQPFGVFQQINNQASFQVTGLVIAIYLLSRPYVSGKKVWKTTLVLLTILLSTIIITASGSRIGILTSLIAVSWIVGSRYKYLLRKRITSLIALLAFLSGIMLGSSGLAIVLDKTIAINSGLSANARLGIYAVCIEMIKEKPIFGYGLGSFEHEFHNAKGEFQENNPNTKLISLYLTHPHNEIMFWLIEGGIIATVGLVTVLIGIILSLLVNRKVRRMSYFALLIPIGLHTQVELPFYISSIHWFTLLFLIFVVMRTEQSKFKKLMSLSMITTVKISSIITALIGVIFFVHTYVSSKEVNAMITGIDLWGLKYAPQNPYFSEVIDEMRMRSALTALYMDNKVDEIKELLPDAEEQLYRRPNPLLYVQVAMAYQKIGDEENMCRTLRDGIKIYPDEPNLQSGVTYCH